MNLVDNKCHMYMYEVYAINIYIIKCRYIYKLYIYIVGYTIYKY